MKILQRLAGFCILLGLSMAAFAAGNAQAGAEKANACGACHGQDGNSTNPIWPNLAGQHPGYLVKQLQNFKDGERENDQMAPMAAALDEQAMQDLAAFYADQYAVPGVADAEQDVIELGESIYRGGIAETGVAACSACHGPTGRGNPAANYPSIAGQHAEYTVVQLQAFRSAMRDNDLSRMMRDTAKRMTDDGIKAVAAYIEGLRPATKR